MTIANNGVKAQPKLIKSFVDKDGKTRTIKTPKDERVVSETTASQVRTMLQGAVENGTGKLANVAGYSVAGKTGTARKPPYNKPHYRYMASFAGFAPANNPRLAAIVILDEPQGQIYGGAVAAPVFSRIMQSALRIMAVDPDKAIQGQQVMNVSSRPVKPATPVTVTTVAP